MAPHDTNTERQAKRHATPLITMAVLVVLVIAGFFWWVGRATQGPDDVEHNAVEAPAATAPATPAPEAPPAATPMTPAPESHSPAAPGAEQPSTEAPATPEPAKP